MYARQETGRKQQDLFPGLLFDLEDGSDMFFRKDVGLSPNHTAL
jgi:hypothetical protein